MNSRQHIIRLIIQKYCNYAGLTNKYTLSKGIEPLTSRLTVVCSNQLSYESNKPMSNYYKANSFLKELLPRFELGFQD